MTEYLKDMETWKPGTPKPPINLGPYDNPLLWNMLDPYGADRSHQRRPISVSRTTMEMHHVPVSYRDHCVHRYMPFHQCNRNVRPMSIGSPQCHEFMEAWQECRAFEWYKSEQVMERFKELTADYTDEDKNFFPSRNYISIPYSYNMWYWSNATSMRLSGWDEKDPKNPVWWREPNRAMMRAEFSPTNWEDRITTAVFGIKLIPGQVVDKELGEFPIADHKKPVYESNDGKRQAAN
jgi:hypothetical protein